MRNQDRQPLDDSGRRGRTSCPDITALVQSPPVGLTRSAIRRMNTGTGPDRHAAEYAFRYSARRSECPPPPGVEGGTSAPCQAVKRVAASSYAKRAGLAIFKRSPSVSLPCPTILAITLHSLPGIPASESARWISDVISAGM